MSHGRKHFPGKTALNTSIAITLYNQQRLDTLKNLPVGNLTREKCVHGPFTPNCVKLKQVTKPRKEYHRVTQTDLMQTLPVSGLFVLICKPRPWATTTTWRRHNCGPKFRNWLVWTNWKYFMRFYEEVILHLKVMLIRILIRKLGNRNLL